MAKQKSSGGTGFAFLVLIVAAAFVLSGGGHAFGSAHTASGAVKAYAASLVSAGQMSCLDALWAQESSWNPSAVNPSSGAYGIPQANPSFTGGEWGAYSASDPQAQVRWGLGYISQRYGSPCAAEQHEQQMGWY